MPANGSSSGIQQGGGNGSRTKAESVRVTTGSVAIPPIEKLKGRENYLSWKFAMRMIWSEAEEFVEPKLFDVILMPCFEQGC